MIRYQRTSVTAVMNVSAVLPPASIRECTSMHAHHYSLDAEAICGDDDIEFEICTLSAFATGCRIVVEYLILDAGEKMRP